MRVMRLELKGPIFDELFLSAKISRLDHMILDQISSKLADEGIRQGELAFATRVGREEGREEGRQEATIKIIQRMLEQGLSWDLITQTTQVDQNTFELLKKTP